MAGGVQGAQGLGGGAHDRTDPTQDRSYWINQSASPNRAVRQQAREALDNLRFQEKLHQRNEALRQRETALQQQQINHEATERRIIAHQNAMEMDRQLKIDRDTEIDEQGHGLLLSMMQLDAAKRRGEITKSQYDDGLLNAAAQFPMGLHHPEAKKHLEFVTKEADRQNDFLARRKVIEDAKVAARLSGPPPEKIMQRYARVQGDISAFQAASKVEEAANIKKKLANEPFTKASDLAGATREAALLEQSYPSLTGQVQQSPSVATPATTPSLSPTPQPSPTADTRPVPGFNIPILENAPATQAIVQPSASPEQTPPAPAHLGTYNPATGEFE